ncbi:hypothetical protein [Pseudomonas sp. Pseusp16]|uniref:hypothetical protein n=1 Tax=Pseudomonas sp. Pseusp16 TaxID=3243021 RepID=UPI0039B44472
MDVNENACSLNERSVLESIASGLAPTGEQLQFAKTMVKEGAPATDRKETVQGVCIALMDSV